VILDFLARESLNLELWLERYEDLKLGGLGTSQELFSKNQGSGYRIPDRGLISQKSRGLSA
jgi:hypothetical protein